LDNTGIELLFLQYKIKNIAYQHQKHMKQCTALLSLLLFVHQFSNVTIETRLLVKSKKYFAIWEKS